MKLDKEMIRVALAGNPNSGKTTMFNLLTGARQRVGNYPGVTVECREGMLEHSGYLLNVVDLPGIYSLNAYSPEEIIAQQYLLHESPHIVIVVVDSTALERSLYFIIQLLELNLKVIVALNMIDEAKNSGIKINITKLQKELGIDIIPTIARKGYGKNELLDSVTAYKQPIEQVAIKIDYGAELEHTIKRMDNIIKSTSFLDYYHESRTIAIRYLERDTEIQKEGISCNPDIHNLLISEVFEATKVTTSYYNNTPESMIADKRYDYISSKITSNIIHWLPYNQTKKDITEITDKILTSPLIGTIFLCLILYFTFWFATSFSETPMNWIESFFEVLTSYANAFIPKGHYNSLVTNGILAGIGSVLSFVPIIGLMFIAISILEDSGYMARMSYMLDKVFRIFGLHGNSILALIVSGGIGAGCAVPGVMATRTLKSPKEKIATILTAPIMSCGAKLPVFTLLSAAFFPEHITESLFIITSASWVFALLIAKLLRSTIITGKPTPFLMELPPYRLPTLKSIIIHSWGRVWQYIRKAGTIILGVTIILWASMSYPLLPAPVSRQFEIERDIVKKNTIISESEKTERLRLINNHESENKLINSYAGRVGKAIEPISKLAGFDWKINISLLGGFAAKEVIISTLATAFSMNEVSPEENNSFSSVLKNTPSFSKATAISLILFTMLYAPCFVTVVVIGREAGKKWAVFSIIFNTFFAFVISTIFYQLAVHYYS